MSEHGSGSVRTKLSGFAGTAGVGSVDDRDAATAGAGARRTHRVRAGDTCVSLLAAHYREPELAPIPQPERPAVLQLSLEKTGQLAMGQALAGIVGRVIELAEPHELISLYQVAKNGLLPDAASAGEMQAQQRRLEAVVAGKPKKTGMAAGLTAAGMGPADGKKGKAPGRALVMRLGATPVQPRPSVKPEKPEQTDGTQGTPARAAASASGAAAVQATGAGGGASGSAAERATGAGGGASGAAAERATEAGGSASGAAAVEAKSPVAAQPLPKPLGTCTPTHWVVPNAVSGPRAIDLVRNDEIGSIPTSNEKVSAGNDLGPWLSAAPGPELGTSYKNTDMKALESRIRERVARDPQHYGIASADEIRHLTPQRAMLLARQLVMDVETYNDAAVQKKGDEFTPEALKLQGKLDAAGIHEYFADVDGICRNIAVVMVGVFDTLRQLQEPKPSPLDNCYMKAISSPGVNHAWNAFFVVKPDGNVAVTQLDATFSDTDTADKDYSTGAIAEGAPAGVRAYWLERKIWTGTRIHKEYLDAFKEVFGGSSSISLEQTRAAGLPQTLAAIRAMPTSLQAMAFGSFKEDAQAAILAYCSAHNEPADFKTQPQGTDSFYRE